MIDLRQAAQALSLETQAAMMASKGAQQDVEQALQTITAALSFLEGIPSEGSPSIMVPLGKAAFFPGRLVDTQRCQIRMGTHAVDDPGAYAFLCSPASRDWSYQLTCTCRGGHIP